MLLKVSNLSKSFGGVTAVNDVSFEVNRGSIFALIGPNGAGKTTIFNLMTGLLTPDSGVITLKDRKLTGLKPFQVATAGITRTFQNLQLFGEMTVMENMIAGSYLKGRTGFVRSMLQRFGKSMEDKKIIEEARHLLEKMGLEKEAGRKAAELSFGRQRLLEIARALASNPNLLLLDEPASGLNSEESDSLVAYLKKLQEDGLTMLLIEHDMETVMKAADRILVLNFGCKIAEGTPEEVRVDPEVVRAYLGEDDDVA